MISWSVSFFLLIFRLRKSVFDFTTWRRKKRQVLTCVTVADVSALHYLRSRRQMSNFSSSVDTYFEDRHLDPDGGSLPIGRYWRGKPDTNRRICVSPPPLSLSATIHFYWNNKRTGNMSKGGVSGERSLQGGKSTTWESKKTKRKGRRDIEKEEANDGGLIH